MGCAAAWGCSLLKFRFPGENPLSLHVTQGAIARLRKKLPDGAIETVRGLGYRLVAP